MPKFNVYATITVPISVCLGVEAENEEAASAAARKKIVEDKDYTVRDFDGNQVDFIEKDIAIDNVEAA